MVKRVNNRRLLRKITLENAKELGLNYIGEGDFGVCYLDEKNGIVYKLFKITPSSAPYSFISPLCLCKLKKFKINRIAFPHEIIKKKGKIKGITYDYVPGKTLSQIIEEKEKVSANEFIGYYKELIKLVPYLSKKNIKIIDLNIKNVILNEEGFNIIDVDAWTVSKYYNHTENNIQEINATMREFITACNFVFEDPNQIINDNKDFKHALVYTIQLIPLNYNLAYIISEIQSIIQNSSSYDDLVESMYAFADTIMENEKKHKQ